MSKVIKNQNRAKYNQKINTIPQYKLLGITPEVREPAEVSSMISKSENINLNENDNPRLRLNNSGFDVSKQIPNVGNNEEHNWCFGMDSLVDDISSKNIDNNHPMIDNNNFIENDSEKSEKNYISDKELDTQLNDTDSIISADVDTYFLFIKNELITTGSLEEIQELAFQMVIGEHEICNNEPISIKDISILRKVKIKMGLFLE